MDYLILEKKRRKISAIVFFVLVIIFLISSYLSGLNPHISLFPPFKVIVLLFIGLSAGIYVATDDHIKHIKKEIKIPVEL